MTSIEAKQQHINIRRSIVTQIRSLLRIKGIKEIEFNDNFPNKYQSEDEEQFTGYRIADSIDEEDIIYVGIIDFEFTDINTEPLIWILEQVESENYEIIENIS